MILMRAIGALVFTPGVAEPRPVTITLPKEWQYKELNEELLPLLGSNAECIEHVAVLFKDAQADMFVDEYGAMNHRGRPPLPVN
jgi:hypothetical protein